MQHWLSGYANWYAIRNRRSGHLYQGRYKAFPVEDERYYWNLSRYIHLNPCNGGKPLAPSPKDCPYSSFAGYARKSKRNDWIDYEEHFRYWQGLKGGRNPEVVYRKFVKAEVVDPPDPTADRLKDWVYGGTDFPHRILAMADGDDSAKNTRRRRRHSPVTMELVIEATAKEYGVSTQEYSGFRSGAGGRDVAANLSRRYTTRTLAEISARFGLGHPDSASDLIKRGRASVEANDRIKNRTERIEKRLKLNPESRV